MRMMTAGVIPWILLSLASAMNPALAEGESSIPPLNLLVLSSVREMPHEGGYSTSGIANEEFLRAVIISGNTLHVEASQAIPSYCSEATYLVFLKTLSLLQHGGRLTLSSETMNELRPTGQPDGVGIWGRWNANGPGTARLFRELGLGPNFTDLNMARPGDFLKIFWNDAIGASEHGHSVIFLGTESRNGVPCLRFWSSNLHAGYGEKTVPLSRIQRMLFSRLESPQNIDHPLMNRRDSYLSWLEHHSSSSQQMEKECGLAR
jgi:hypothetical protein